MDPRRKAFGRRRRKRRVRKRVFGLPERPRLTVFRSRTNIYGQIIDDASGRTLLAASTLSKEVRGRLRSGGNAAAAKVAGSLLGERAAAAGVEKVVFDRNGYRYHGRVKAFADAVREAGLKF